MQIAISEENIKALLPHVDEKIGLGFERIVNLILANDTEYNNTHTRVKEHYFIDADAQIQIQNYKDFQVSLLSAVSEEKIIDVKYLSLFIQNRDSEACVIIEKIAFGLGSVDVSYLVFTSDNDIEKKKRMFIS